MYAGRDLRRGVRATRKFSKGEFVLEYAGDYISTAKEYKARLQMYNEQNVLGSFFFEFKHFNQSKWWAQIMIGIFSLQNYCFWMSITDDLLNKSFRIDATPESNQRLGRLVNHVRGSGNLKPSVYEFESRPRILFHASRDIEKGEQLFYDYGDYSKESLRQHSWLRLSKSKQWCWT